VLHKPSIQARVYFEETPLKLLDLVSSEASTISAIIEKWRLIEALQELWVQLNANGSFTTPHD
jgi:hypothetical protein